MAANVTSIETLAFAAVPAELCAGEVVVAGVDPAAVDPAAVDPEPAPPLLGAAMLPHAASSTQAPRTAAATPTWVVRTRPFLVGVGTRSVPNASGIMPIG